MPLETIYTTDLWKERGALEKAKGRNHNIKPGGETCWSPQSVHAIAHDKAKAELTVSE